MEEMKGKKEGKAVIKIWEIGKEDNGSKNAGRQKEGNG